MKHTLLALLAFAGCWGGDFSHLPDQDLAERVIWRDTYGMTEAPPPVDWIHETGITGTEGASGLTIIGWKVEVACRFPGTGDGLACNEPIQQTAYAHELFHWWCWVRTGDVDVFHSHCDWRRVSEAQDAFGRAIVVQRSQGKRSRVRARRGFFGSRFQSTTSPYPVYVWRRADHRRRVHPRHHTRLCRPAAGRAMQV